MTELELREWLAGAPPGTLVPAGVLAQALASGWSADRSSPGTQESPSWRERLWLVPPDTRLGAAELLDAIGRTRSWLYRHTGPNSPGSRIPHRKLDGELVFLAGEVRQWLQDTEQVVVRGRPSTTELTLGRKAR